MPDTPHIKRYRERWNDYPAMPGHMIHSAIAEEMLDDLAGHIERLEAAQPERYAFKKFTGKHSGSGRRKRTDTATITTADGPPEGGTDDPGTDRADAGRGGPVSEDAEEDPPNQAQGG